MIWANRTDGLVQYLSTSRLGAGQNRPVGFVARKVSPGCSSDRGAVRAQLWNSSSLGCHELGLSSSKTAATGMLRRRQATS